MHPTTRTGVLAGLTLAGLLVGTPALADPVGANQQVALVDETGQQLDVQQRHSAAPVRSSRHDGRFVVFSTAAPLVARGRQRPRPTSTCRDTVAGPTVLVSQRHGRPGNDDSFEPTVSANWPPRSPTPPMATNLTGTQDGNSHALDVVVTQHRHRPAPRGSRRPPPASSAPEQLLPRDLRQRPGRRLPVVRLLRRPRRRPSRGRLRRTCSRRQHRQVSLHPDGRDVARLGPDRRHLRQRRADRVRRRQPPVGPEPGPEDARGSGRSRLPAVPALPDGQRRPAGDLRRRPFVASRPVRPTCPARTATRPTLPLRALLPARSPGLTRPGDGNSYLPTLSRTGRFVGFGSDASNLVTGRHEGQPDAFVADVRTGEVSGVSQAADGTGGNNWSATTRSRSAVTAAHWPTSPTPTTWSPATSSTSARSSSAPLTPG